MILLTFREGIVLRTSYIHVTDREAELNKLEL